MMSMDKSLGTLHYLGKFVSPTNVEGTTEFLVPCNSPVSFSLLCLALAFGV